MAKTANGKKISVLQKTFESWKKEFDPDDKWLQGKALFEGSKKIGQITCGVCAKRNDLDSAACSKCCGDFVDGKSELGEKSIKKHARCKHHLQALNHPKDQIVEPGDNQLQILNAEQNKIQTPNNEPTKLESSNKPAGETTNINAENGNVISGCIAEKFIVNHNAVTMPLTEQDVMTAIRRILKATYNKMVPYLRLPWLPEKIIDFHDYTYDIELSFLKCIDSKGVDLTSSEWHLRMSDIFECVDNKKPIRIFFQNTMGFACSGILLQLCYDWSNGDGPFANMFDLVIFIDGARLMVDSLDTLIIDRCRAGGIDDDTVLKTIKNNAKTLFIISDFNADHGTKKSKLVSLKQFFERSTYADTTTLISCQHTCCFTLPGESLSYCVQHPSYRGTGTSCMKLLEFDGLSTEHEIQFMTKNLAYYHMPGCEVEMLKSKSLRYLPEDELLFPLFHLLLTFVGLDDDLEASNKTDLYKILFSTLFQDYHRRNNEDESGLSDLFNFDLDDISPDARQLSSFGEFFLEKFNKGPIALTYNEVQSHFGNNRTILDLGILMGSSDREGSMLTGFLEPLHHSLIEFLIAFYLRIVYKTNSRSQFLKKTELLNEVKPPTTIIDSEGQFACLYNHFSHPQFANGVREFLELFIGRDEFKK